MIKYHKKYLAPVSEISALYNNIKIALEEVIIYSKKHLVQKMCQTLK
jgi:hypothetical protein